MTASNEHSPIDDDVFSDDHYSVNNSFESCFDNDFSEEFSELDSFQYDSAENDSHQRTSDGETGDRNSQNMIDLYDEGADLVRNKRKEIRLDFDARDHRRTSISAVSFNTDASLLGQSEQTSARFQPKGSTSLRPAKQRGFSRSVSSPTLVRRPSTLLPGAVQQPWLRSSNFTQYRHSQASYSPASPTVTPDSSFSQENTDPITDRRWSRSSQYSAISLHPPISEYEDEPAAASSRDLQQTLLEGHPASDEWYQLYIDLDVGSIPTPQQCSHAPLSQKALAKIPVLKSTRINSIHGHFFVPVNNGTFECRVKDDHGLFCGKAFKKTGSSDARLNHIATKHAEVHHALHEFRSYQERVKEHLKLQNPDSVSNYPAVKITRGNASCGNKKQMPFLAQDPFEEVLIQIVAVHGIAFNFIQSDLFKKLCAILNQAVKIPSTEALKRKLYAFTGDRKIRLKEHINSSITKAAITTDCWTSHDQRGFLGVTLHFITPTFNLASVVIGMERLEGPHTSEALLKKLSSVINDWGLQNKLISGTTDQGANIKKAMRLLAKDTSIKWIPCSAHMIQLCINTSLVIPAFRREPPLHL